MTWPEELNVRNVRTYLARYRTFSIAFHIQKKRMKSVTIIFLKKKTKGDPERLKRFLRAKSAALEC